MDQTYLLGRTGEKFIEQARNVFSKLEQEPNKWHLTHAIKVGIFPSIRFIDPSRERMKNLAPLHLLSLPLNISNNAIFSHRNKHISIAHFSLVFSAFHTIVLFALSVWCIVLHTVFQLVCFVFQHNLIVVCCCCCCCCIYCLSLSLLFLYFPVSHGNPNTLRGWENVFVSKIDINTILWYFTHLQSFCTWRQ